MAQRSRRHTALAEGPGFSSQNPHDNSQPLVTQVPGDPMLSSDLHTLGIHMQVYRHTCRQTLIFIK